MTKRKKTTLGVVHVTATPPRVTLTNDSLRSMHLARGFSDIGYNEWITRNKPGQKPQLMKGRGVDAIGAHVAGFNSISYGISLEGGVNADMEADFSTITPEQLELLEQRMREITKKYPNIKWCGHRDLSPDKDGDGIIESHEWLKECPCFDVIPWAAKRGLPTADIRGNWNVIELPSDRTDYPVVEVYDGPDTRNAYLQRLLTKAGFPVGDDGIVGPKTKAAIKAFQQVHGLKVTSVFDSQTVDYLRDLMETEAKKENGSKGITEVIIEQPQPKLDTHPVRKQPKGWFDKLWIWLFGT